MEKNVYTKYLTRINDLGKSELSNEILSKMRDLYRELEEKINSVKNPEVRNECDLPQDIRIIINGYRFLMNELKYTLFDILKKENKISRNSVIRRMVDVLELKDENIVNLIGLYNHAFVVKENNGKEEMCLLPDYLKEISSSEFCLINDSESINEKLVLEVISNVLYAINQVLMPNDLQVFLDNQNITYNNPDLHIYFSDNIEELCHHYLGNSIDSVEIIVQYDQKIEIFVMDIRKTNIKILPIDYLTWKLNDDVNSKKMEKSY